MKQSEDVSKLFAMFGEEKADQYREVYEADQNRATLERWPMFQRIRVGAELPETRAQRPTPAVPPQQPVEDIASRPAPAQQAAPTISRALFVQPQVSEPAPAHVPPAQEATSLSALFRRLEGAPAPAAPQSPIASALSKPASANGSIRSLFNRLNRS